MVVRGDELHFKSSVLTSAALQDTCRNRYLYPFNRTVPQDANEKRMSGLFEAF
jgi:hypothetical protein